MKFLSRKLRHEHKYYIHPAEYLTLRERLSPLLTLDSYSSGREGYGIRSLYFDSPHDDALYDKLNGIFSREKFRIRIYNGSDGAIKLERKSKYGDYVSKEAASLGRSDYERILKGDVSSLKDSEIPLVMDFYRAVAVRGFRPSAIVDYTREAYVYGYDDVRITFDKKLSSGINSWDLFDPNLSLVEALEAEKTILEIKYNRYLPESVKALIQMRAHSRSTISKYLICREAGMRHFKPLR